MNNTSCEQIATIKTDRFPVVTIMFFSAGVIGNVLALVILTFHKRQVQTKSSVFCILVTGLTITDLLGTCFLSPVVLVSYAKNASILGLLDDKNPFICEIFAFAMTFFGLSSILILFAMAIERCMAISHPYFYSKHIGTNFAKLGLPIIYIFCVLFCSLPFFDFGKHKQYCPGTWCFIKMKRDTNPKVVSFSLLYASLVAFSIVAIFLCNGSVIVSLCKMYQNQKYRRSGRKGSVVSSHRRRRRKSWFGQHEQETDHLLLLALMTIIFVICSLPLTLVSVFDKQALVNHSTLMHLN
ncbi:prostacyclin receptor [Latimeria chalumnae]|uniref:prostacyclin receptor n=1 Tax=Latimeria chalumnae TaxID=7897 RepID=UPI0003C174F9|nr:PREDICTED: prostacyclin receptor [Latimeria chalumnae]|eukprot:XP_006008953.1 PREDICTED: prostacyclin receptor [Latimeria chalumnae]